MKKYSILIMLALGAAAVSSCKDFLIQENPNKIESEYFFTDESSLILYTNGLTRSYATAIKSFIDGDKYSDAMSWDGEYLYYTPRYTAEASKICARQRPRRQSSTTTKEWAVSSGLCST